MDENTNEIAVTKTYSMTLRHIAMVSDMADRLSRTEGVRVSQGEVLRRAVELMWEALDDIDGQPGKEG